jgi:hypothetical protein
VHGCRPLRPSTAFDVTPFADPNPGRADGLGFPVEKGHGSAAAVPAQALKASCPTGLGIEIRKGERSPEKGIAATPPPQYLQLVNLLVYWQEPTLKAKTG